MHSDWIHLIIVESRTRERTYFISFGVNRRNGRAIKSRSIKSKELRRPDEQGWSYKKTYSQILKADA